MRDLSFAEIGSVCGGVANTTAPPMPIEPIVVLAHAPQNVVSNSLWEAAGVVAIAGLAAAGAVALLPAEVTAATVILPTLAVFTGVSAVLGMTAAFAGTAEP